MRAICKAGLCLSVATIVTWAGLAPASASEQNVYEYSGRLLESGLTVNGPRNLEFRFFDHSADGTQVGPTLYADNVVVENGLFVVDLDFGAAALDETRQHWLEITVDGEQLSSRKPWLQTFDVERSAVGGEKAPEIDEAQPEQNEAQTEPSGATDLTTSGEQGNQTGRSDNGSRGPLVLERDEPWFISDPDNGGGIPPVSLGGGMEASSGIWDTRGSKYYYNGGNVGIGTGNPAYTLEIKSSRGRAVSVDNTMTTGTRFGVWARSRSTNGRAIFGWAAAETGNTYGVWGESKSATGRGVYGVAASATGENYGVYGRSLSEDGFGGYFVEIARVANTFDDSYVDIRDDRIEIGNPDGVETVQIDGGDAVDGNSGAEIRLSNIAPADGGPVSTVVLTGDNGNGAGRIEVRDNSGSTGIRLEITDDSDGGSGHGEISLHDTFGNDTIILDGGFNGVPDGGPDGGQIRIASGSFDDGNPTTIVLHGNDTNGGGGIDLLNQNGTTTIELNADNATDGGSGSDLLMRNASGNLTIDLDADSNGAGDATFYNEAGEVTIAIDGAEGGADGPNDDGGQIRVSNGVSVDGGATNTVTINGDDADDGGRINILKDTGVMTISLDADDGTGGLMRMRNDNGIDTVVFDSDFTIGKSAGLLINENDGSIELAFFNNTLTINDDGGDPAFVFNGNSPSPGGVIATADYGPRQVSSIQSTEVWLEDLGTAQLIGGSVRVDLDPVFLQTATIDPQHPMQVFITLYGQSKGVYVERGLDHFVVHELDGGAGFAEFGYRVVAKRRGLEQQRLPVYTAPGGSDGRDQITASK